MRRSWVALAATLALAGCGGDDDRSARSVTVPAGGELRASAKEYSYDPGRVTVEKAGPLRIILRNDGELAHDLRIRKGERDLGGTPPSRAAPAPRRCAWPPASTRSIAAWATTRSSG